MRNIGRNEKREREINKSVKRDEKPRDRGKKKE